MKARKVAIIGSRKTEGYDNIIKEIFADELEPTDVILLGGAAGVSTMAKDYADTNEIAVVTMAPWNLIDPKVKFSPKLFFNRNKQLMDNCDVAMVLTDGNKDSEVDRALRYLMKTNIPHITIDYTEEGL